MKSWDKTFKWHGKRYTYGWIDDGKASRYYLFVNDEVAPISLADAIVPLLAEMYGPKEETSNTGDRGEK